MDIKKTVGTRINAALARCNMLQKDLAKALGVTDNTISYYCKGARGPQLEQLPIIAEVLNTTTDHLLGISDDPSIQKSAVDDLGLSPEAIDVIIRIREQNDANLLDALNNLIEAPSFPTLLLHLSQYIDAVESELEFQKKLEHSDTSYGWLDEGIMVDRLTSELRKMNPQLPEIFTVIGGYETVVRKLEQIKSDIEFFLTYSTKKYELDQLYRR